MRAMGGAGEGSWCSKVAEKGLLVSGVGASWPESNGC